MDSTAKCCNSIEWHCSGSYEEKKDDCEVPASSAMQTFEDCAKAKKSSRSVTDMQQGKPKKKQRKVKRSGRPRGSSNGALAAGRAILAEQSGLGSTE